MSWRIHKLLSRFHFSLGQGMSSSIVSPAMANPPRPWKAEYAKSGRSSCKTCKSPIDKEQLRLGKMVTATQFDGFMPVKSKPYFLFPFPFILFPSLSPSCRLRETSITIFCHVEMNFFLTLVCSFLAFPYWGKCVFDCQI